jgi:hypothetical protein
MTVAFYQEWTLSGRGFNLDFLFSPGQSKEPQPIVIARMGHS